MVILVAWVTLTITIMHKCICSSDQITASIIPLWIDNGKSHAKLDNFSASQAPSNNCYSAKKNVK